MRYRFIVLGGLIFGGLVAYYFLWVHLVDQVGARATAWIDSQRSLGRVVSYDRMQLWGFPYRLSVTFENLRWHDPQAAAGWDLQADSITAHLQVWQPDHVIFDLKGAQRIGWRSIATAGNPGQPQLATLTTAQFRASLVTDATGTWQRADADLKQPSFGGVLADWRADRLRLHGRRGGNLPPSTDLAVEANDLTLPAAADGPLGRTVTDLKLVGSLRGAIYGRTPEDMLATWREAGGILDLDTIALHWGALRLEGSGSLAVDRKFRPLGAMSGKIYGASHGIDALAAAGQMTAQEAAAARAAVTMLQLPDAGKQPYLPVPLSAQQGRLFLGPVPLFSLPSVLPVTPKQ